MTAGAILRKASTRAVVITAASIFGLFVIDRFLAQVEQTELGREARGDFDRGLGALHAARPAGAVIELQRAHSLERGNREYHLAFIEALMAAGRRDQAASQLRDLLSRDSNDGQANLLMARLLSEIGRADEANAFYHRAIYGTWYADAGSKRQQARLELAGYLARQDKKQELLSELLVLESQEQNDPKLAFGVARMFLIAGSPARAVSVYRDILKHDEDNIDAWLGMGEAELQAGNFRAAQSAFLDALRHKPSDTAVLQRAAFVNTLMLMDPTPRRLTSGEKYRRSTGLLAAVRDEVVSQCPAAVSQTSVKTLLDQAETMLSNRARTQVTNEMSERVLTLAEQLWPAKRRTCPGPGRPGDPVALLMGKLTSP